jgi:hypothetical protein
MAIITLAQDVKSASCEAVVVRCGCTAEQKQSAHWHGITGRICPNPRRIEDRGTIAYWHRNPLRRGLWRVSRWLRGEF